jgi:hypothetical protein
MPRETRNQPIRMRASLAVVLRGGEPDYPAIAGTLAELVPPRDVIAGVETELPARACAETEDERDR